MPQAAIAAIAEYAASISASTYFAIAVTVVTTAYNYEQQQSAKRAAKASYNASLTDHTVMIRSAIAPRNIVYGRDKISGPLVFGTSTGDKGQFLHLVVPLAGHECDGIETIYFNEVALPDPDPVDGFVKSGAFCKVSSTSMVDSAGSPTPSIALSAVPARVISVTATVPGVSSSGQDQTATFDAVLIPSSGYSISGGVCHITAPVSGASDYTINYETDASKYLVRIRKHLGGPGQVADPDLIAECPGLWTSAHVGVGVAYLAVRLEYDTDVFGQIGVPNIAAVPRGKKVRDPRIGLTVWSENSALCTADYVKDPLLGLGSLAAEVPDAELVAAANISDEAVMLDHTGATQKRYTTNGTISCSDGRRTNLTTLLEPMAGSAVWTQGRWLIRAGAARSSEFTLDETWIAPGPRQILPRNPRNSLFNAVTGTYIDPAQGYAEVQFPPVLNAFYEANDGGRRITTDVQMPLVNDPIRAQRLAKIKLERARQALTLKVTCNMRAYDTLPSQVGAMSLARYGYSAKPAEVRERTFDPSASTVSLTLVETASSVWDWNYGEATLVDAAPDTNLPDPFTPPAALAGLVVYTGTAQLLKMADGTIITRGLVRWSASTDVFVQEGGTIETQWKLDNATYWQSAPPVPGDSAETIIGPLDDRRLTLVRVRPVNGLGRTGAWTTVTVVVVGKTERPIDVADMTATFVASGVRAAWGDDMEADYDSTELRVGSVWETAVPLFRGTASAYNWLSPAPGTYTLLAKHYDTSGNESQTATSVVVVVTPAAALQWSSIVGKPASTRPNVLSNGGFESGLSGWVGDTTGWTVIDSIWGRQAIRQSSFGGTGALASALFVVAPNAHYVITGDSLLFAAAGNCYFDMLFYGADGSTIVLDGPQNPLLTTHDFAADDTNRNAHAVQVTAPANAVYARARFVWEGVVSGTAVGCRQIKVERGDLPATGYSAESALVVAQAAAASAQQAASAATTQLTTFADNNILDRSEKPDVLLDWQALVGNQTGNNVQAVAYGITVELTDYNAKISALSGYLQSIGPGNSGWQDATVDSPIDRSVFVANWAAAYAAEGALLSKIAAVAGTRASWTGVANRPLLLRVAASGNNDTGHLINPGVYNGESGALYAGSARSYGLAKWRRADGAFTFLQFYDVFSAGTDSQIVFGYGRGAAQLAADLNSCGPDTIVVVWTADEPRTNRLTDGLDAAMYRCGASRAVFGSPQFHFRSAYILIGIGGCGEGNGFESYSGSVDADTNAWCDVAFTIQAGTFMVTGAGATPRTLADYSYSGDLNATYGADWGTNVANISVTTQQIAPSAVSSRVVFTDAAGVMVSLAG